ncbi:MAG: undecaprenyl-diphosphate phosphatase [Ruminococcaceae bacterium]|nr:undecaprenyl-diphosphate phosphatase [Oscillospiraceae bacterium]
MELIIALFFGIIQGATEFLPISGGGHLAMIQNYNQTVFGAELFSPTLSFDIMLRLGTLAAIIFVFYSDIKRIGREFMMCIGDIIHKRFSIHTNRPYRQLLYMLVVTTSFLVPAVFLMDYMEMNFSKLSVIAFTLMVTGICNLFIDSIGTGRRRKSVNQADSGETVVVEAESKEEKRSAILSSLEADGPKDVLKKGAVVGAFQLASVIPGISRCSLTVMGGLLAGFRRDFTVKYAFLATIPVLTVKILMQTVTVIRDGIVINWIPYLLGMIAAFASGVFFIGVMRKAVRRNWCKRFGIYCLILGVFITMIQLRG